MSPKPQQNNKIYLILGTALFILFLAQDILDIRWTWLYEAQADQMFKRWTGLALSIFILLQWVLTLVKTINNWSTQIPLFTKIHKWSGAVSPLIYYIHSMEFGYAYLFFLSVSYFLNFGLGLLNTDLIKSKSQLYFQGWMIAHVMCSLIISFVMLFHVYVVFYYK